MIHPTRLLAVSLLFVAASCGHGHEHSGSVETDETEAAEAPEHVDSPAEEDHADESGDVHEGSDGHDEVSLGSVAIGDLDVLLAQGHGAVEAGHEGHLVVKLPYTDQGATVVRAWIGTDDRTLSFVGKGSYSEASDEYDVHATAPVPLPAEPWWWIEIEPPVGEKLLGFARPIL